MQGLVAAALRLGWDVRQSGPQANARLCFGPHAYPLLETELLDRTPHVPTDSELRRKERWSWTRIPDHDYAPSGRLQIDPSTFDGRRRRWSDTTRWTLDDKLGNLLQELQERVVIDEERRVQREALAEQQRLDRARLSTVTQTFAHELDRQVTAWQTAASIRAYCDGLEARVSGADIEDRERVLGWITWAREYATSIDHTSARGRLPHVPAPPDFADHEVESWLRSPEARLDRASERHTPSMRYRR